jgi:hypothetical protein
MESGWKFSSRLLLPVVFGALGGYAAKNVWFELHRSDELARINTIAWLLVFLVVAVAWWRFVWQRK